MRLLHVFVLVLFVVQSLFPIATTAEPQHIEDEDITLAVETELAIDTGVPSHFIKEARVASAIACR
jgi:hypothetical protein